MNVSDIQRADLNLLITFHVLMAERNVTRAATVLRMSQSGVSASLSRLRTLFGDELFIRGRSGMAPTPRALEIAPQIGAAITALESVLTPETHFDPTTSSRQFVIALSDDIEAYAAPKIVARSREQGWRVDFSFRQTNRRLWESAASESDVDAVIIGQPDSSVPASYHAETLFSSTYACVYDGPRLGVGAPISEEEYLSMPHARITFNNQRAFLDDIFAARGRTRRSVATFTHFSGAMSTLLSTDLIMTLPEHAAEVLAETAGLTLSRVPIPCPWFTVELIWGIEREHDPVHQWLRRELVDLLARR